MTGKVSLVLLGKPLYTIPPKNALLKLLTNSNQSETKCVTYRKKINRRNSTVRRKVWGRGMTSQLQSHL